MNDLGPAPTGNALVERVKAILMSPKTEWPRIDTDPISIGEIYKTHVIPLAAIGPVAGFIGGQVFGMGAFGITYRPPLISGLVTAILSYVLALIMIYVLALVIEWLAPKFNAVPNRTQAFKVAAYAATGSWVGGIFGLVPAIAALGIIAGLYSLYLLYLGLPIAMKAPADKAMSYTVVTILCMIGASIVIGLILAPLTMMLAGPAALAGGGLASGGGTVSGTVNVPGVGSVDLAKLEAQSKKMEAAANRMQSGQPANVIAAATLQGLLPASLPGGLARTSVESSTAGAAGVGGSNAEARYGSGDSEIKLSVTDMGAMGALAALGGALGVESSKTTGTSYEKVGKVDGRMTTEKYDSASHQGSYGTMVADRVMVQAEGSATSIEAFKAAVAQVDLSKVEMLAKQ